MMRYYDVCGGCGEYDLKNMILVFLLICVSLAIFTCALAYI